jgi:hypothetical protein
MNAAPAEKPVPIFNWPRRHKIAAFLPGFIVLSLLAHIATFFVFRVVYPERVSIPPPPPQVMLLTPGTPENQAFLRWVESEEPALVVAASAATSAAGLLELKYRPSFENARTLPRMVANVSDNVQFPPAKSPLDIIRSAMPRRAPAPTVTEPAPTTIVFAGALSARPTLPRTKFTPGRKASAPLQPSEFLLGVNEAGEVRYAFLQKSCGMAELDGEIADHLARVSFQPAQEKIAWGTARVLWGDDAYAPAAAQ